MKKTILACDLDNTLIYSYKHRTPDDACVELLEGQEQSFITAKTLVQLRQLPEDMQLVPVTTRSQAQYLRLIWPSGMPELAVTTNGGLLLCAGEPDAAWREKSLKLAAELRPALHKLAEQLDAAQLLRHRLVDEIYLYVVCDDVAAAEKCMADFADFTLQSGLQVRRGGRKVYFLPPNINKGVAAQGLRALFPDSRLVAAGDSELDLPMLEEADIALLPNAALAAQLQNPHKYVCPQNKHFAEFVLAMAADNA